MRSRFIVLASLGLAATAVVGVTMPAGRHLIRDQLARHRHVRFGTAVNTSALSDEDAKALMSDLSAEHGLPASDPIRHGVAGIVDRLDAEFPRAGTA